jgi:uncharacterized protein YqgC (DUF456 family)
MTPTDLLVGLAVAAGLVGILVPVLPGSVLVLAAILVWATEVSSPTGWAVLGVATLLLGLGAVVKYAVPGRHLQMQGIPRGTLVAGGLLGAVGFFVVPVVGLVLGFVLGVYVAEVQRVGRGPAWPSTRAALRAVGLSVLIELAAGLLAALTWVAGVVLV